MTELNKENTDDWKEKLRSAFISAFSGNPQENIQVVRYQIVKCVYFQTFLQISWGIVWGIVYFKFYPRGFGFSTFDYQYFKLFTIFNGKYKLLEPQKCPHNPEVVGSSPASATINSPEINRFQDFFFCFLFKKFGYYFCISA